MKLQSWLSTGFAAVLLLFMSAANAAEWGQQGVHRIEQSGQTPSKSKLMASNFCSSYNIGGEVTGPDDTSGSFGDVTAGDTFTFTATGGGTGTWRIVGDPGGSITYASGGVFPGTLTYQVTADALDVGVGFYVDTYSGEGSTISGTCGDGPTVAVPSMSSWSLILMVFLLGMVGFSLYRRKQAK
jgi:hypothetical protein